MIVGTVATRGRRAPCWTDARGRNDGDLMPAPTGADRASQGRLIRDFPGPPAWSQAGVLPAAPFRTFRLRFDSTDWSKTERGAASGLERRARRAFSGQSRYRVAAVVWPGPVSVTANDVIVFAGEGEDGGQTVWPPVRVLAVDPDNAVVAYLEDTTLEPYPVSGPEAIAELRGLARGRDRFLRRASVRRVIDAWQLDVMCPRCGSAGRVIVSGMQLGPPTPEEEVRYDFAGCTVDVGMPAYSCSACGHLWGMQSTEPMEFAVEPGAWDIAGLVQLDTATILVADPAAIDVSWPPSAEPAVPGHAAGPDWMEYRTGADAGYPVETFTAEGEVTGIRVELVDDVAAIAAAGQGQWEHLGDIDLASPCFLVCDPCYVPKRAGLGRLVREVAKLARSRAVEANGFSLGCVTPAAPGRWRVDIFTSTDDELGVRLLLMPQ